MENSTSSDAIFGDKNVVMAYNSTGLVVHDADAHIMETPTWLRDNADPAFRDRIDALTYPGGNELQQSAIEFDENEDLVAGFERLAQRHQAPDYVAAEEAEIMLRKNYAATGSFLPKTVPGRSTFWGSQASSCLTPSTTAGFVNGSIRAISILRLVPPVPITEEFRSFAR